MSNYYRRRKTGSLILTYRDWLAVFAAAKLRGTYPYGYYANNIRAIRAELHRRGIVL